MLTKLNKEELLLKIRELETKLMRKTRENAILKRRIGILRYEKQSVLKKQSEVKLELKMVLLKDLERFLNQRKGR